MVINKRINFFRNRIGLTQMQLGDLLGFKNADVRISQYESGSRIPNDKLLIEMSNIFHVSPSAIQVPNIDDENGILHTFFALEDFYGFQVENIGGRICLTLDDGSFLNRGKLLEGLHFWNQKYEEFKNGTITKAEYDEWRYNFSFSGNHQLKYCVHCGEEIVGAKVFCSKCGAKI